MPAFERALSLIVVGRKFVVAQTARISALTKTGKLSVGRPSGNAIHLLGSKESQWKALDFQKIQEVTSSRAIA
jgi:hypothetical protein